MLKHMLLTGATVLALTLAAHASQCPADMAKIDEAMQSAQLSEADKAKVMELRKTGEEQHAAGSHAESMATLAEAKKLLNIP
jgi:hypothetical protein